MLKFKKLTKDQKKAYIKSRGTRCPYCKSENISANENIQGDDDYGKCTIICKACNAEWVDIYQLVDIENV